MLDKPVVVNKQKSRQNVSAFRSLLTTPASGAVTLPAGARLAFQKATSTLAGVTAATIVAKTTRTIKTPVLAANELLTLDYAERGAVITPGTGFAVLIDVGLGVYKKISQG